jgi:hypothetical protein
MPTSANSIAFHYLHKHTTRIRTYNFKIENKKITLQFLQDLFLATKLQNPIRRLKRGLKMKRAPTFQAKN